MGLKQERNERLDKNRFRLSLLVLCLLVSGATAQTLAITRPARPARASGTVAPSPPAPGLSIPAQNLWGGIQGSAYSFTFTRSGGNPPVGWSVVSGSLPAGLGLDSASGILSGTPSQAGVFTFTLRAMDATIGDGASQVATRSFTLVISPSGTTYGNVGDAYATEGGAANPNATLLNVCGALNANTSYRLTQNVAAATPGTVCFTLNGSGIKLDLGTRTVTGRISLNASASNISIFNGAVNCDFPDNGGNVGCLILLSTSSVTGPIKVHHLTIRNTAVFSRAFHIDWNSPAANTTPSIQLYNLDVAVSSQPTVVRSYALSILATNHYVEAFNNDITCAGDANACQGISCANGATTCKLHHNRIEMKTNTVEETGRAMSFDFNTQSGEAWNNLVIVNNNRALRIRDSSNIRVHDNTFQAITSHPNLAGTIHLGDPDTGFNDLQSVIDHNRFEGLSGDFKMIFARGAINVTVENNTVVCTGNCNSGLFATVRAVFGNPNAKTEVLLRNNAGVTLSIAPPQIFVESGATVNLCNTGTTFGAGSANAVSCPSSQ
jgi:hypothetical protein